MNTQMWVKALRVIPRISKSDWDHLDLISKWLIATRAAVLIMTFISASIAGLLAIKAGSFDLGKWILLVIGLVFAHAANNLLNDLTDYKRGVDKDNYFRSQYGPQPVQQGLLTQREMLIYTAITGSIALAAGILLIIQSGPLAVWFLLSGAFFLLFYTYPLKNIGLGEIAVILVWGPLMIGGGYYVITGLWAWNVAIASLPFALGATTVIFGKHIDKMEQDKAKGIFTLPVVLGERNARIFALVMMVFMYLLVLYLIGIGFFSPWMLIVFLGLTTIPKVVPIFMRKKPDQKPLDYPGDVWPLWFVASAFLHNRRYGLLFLLGLILDIAIQSFLSM